jgi:serine/threonine protein kinase
MSTDSTQPMQPGGPFAWANVDSADRPPQQLGSCTLISRLGSPGGQGEVWLADEKQFAGTSRRVAVKVFAKVSRHGANSHTAAPPGMSRERDLALASGQDLQVGNLDQTEQGYLYYTMRAVRGRTLCDYCDAEALSWTLRLKIFRQLLDRCKLMHDKGIIHRDLKPQNILVEGSTNDTAVWIIDFGLAKHKGDARNDPADVTEVGTFQGTPEYAAPEVLTGGLAVGDEQSDILSLGIILQELLTGNRLYQPDTQAGKRDRQAQAKEFWALERHPRASELLKHSLTPPSFASTPYESSKQRESLAAALESHLDPVLRFATHEERTRRYQNVDELRKDISAAVDRIHASANAPASNQPKMYWSERRGNDDMYIRDAYRRRVANDAALFAGTDALLDKRDYPRARRLLGLVSDAGRVDFVFKHLFRRAESALLIIEED